MKKFFASSLSLLVGLSAGEAFAEPLLQPLSLERVVIRGQARQGPVRLPRIESEPSQPSASKSTPQLSNNNPLKLQHRLSSQAGRHDRWALSQSLLLTRNLSSFSLSNEADGSNGFREGYQRQQHQHHLEWNQRTSQNLHWKSSYRWSKRKLESPNLSWKRYDGAQKEEVEHQLKLQLETPYSKKQHQKLILEHENAHQNPSGFAKQPSDYRFQLYRVGYLTHFDPWDAAVSLEVEKKNKEQTTLAKLFFKHEKKIIDDRSSLHWGLGVHILSSRQSNLNRSGLLSLKAKNKNNTLSFSPYLQFDHRLSSKAALFASYQQFYQKAPILDFFFDNFEADTPANIIQPTLHRQFEMGLRWNIHQSWNISLSHEIDNIKDQHVQVIDHPSSTGRLTMNTWDSGISHTTRLEFKGRIHQHWFLDLEAQHLKSHWDFPNIDFTPFKAKHQWQAHFHYKRKKWDLKWGYSYESGLLTYPIVQSLKNKKRLHLKGHWNSYRNLHLHAAFSNILSQGGEASIGYPNPPWQSQLGASVHF